MSKSFLRIIATLLAGSLLQEPALAFGRNPEFKVQTARCLNAFASQALALEPEMSMLDAGNPTGARLAESAAALLRDPEQLAQALGITREEARGAVQNTLIEIPFFADGQQVIRFGIHRLNPKLPYWSDGHPGGFRMTKAKKTGRVQLINRSLGDQFLMTFEPKGKAFTLVSYRFKSDQGLQITEVPGITFFEQAYDSGSSTLYLAVNDQAWQKISLKFWSAGVGTLQFVPQSQWESNAYAKIRPKQIEFVKPGKSSAASAIMSNLGALAVMVAVAGVAGLQIADHYFWNGPTIVDTSGMLQLQLSMIVLAMVFVSSSFVHRAANFFRFLNRSRKSSAFLGLKSLIVMLAVLPVSRVVVHEFGHSLAYLAITGTYTARFEFIIRGHGVGNLAGLLRFMMIRPWYLLSGAIVGKTLQLEFPFATPFGLWLGYWDSHVFVDISGVMAVGVLVWILASAAGRLSRERSSSIVGWAYFFEAGRYVWIASWVLVSLFNEAHYAWIAPITRSYGNDWLFAAVDHLLSWNSAMQGQWVGHNPLGTSLEEYIWLYGSSDLRNLISLDRTHFAFLLVGFPVVLLMIRWIAQVMKVHWGKARLSWSRAFLIPFSFVLTLPALLPVAISALFAGLNYIPFLRQHPWKSRLLASPWGLTILAAVLAVSMATILWTDRYFGWRKRFKKTQGDITFEHQLDEAA